MRLFKANLVRGYAFIHTNIQTKVFHIPSNGGFGRKVDLPAEQGLQVERGTLADDE